MILFLFLAVYESKIEYLFQIKFYYRFRFYALITDQKSVIQSGSQLQMSDSGNRKQA